MLKNISHLIAALAILAAGSFVSAGEDGSKSAVTARVYQFVGTVQIRPADKPGWYKPVAGMALRDGDTVRTGADGWITFAFDNASIIRVAAGSELVIAKLRYDASTRSVESTLKFPGSGKLLAVIRKYAKSRNSLDIFTPVAVAGVRGTDLMVESSPDSATVAVFEGKIVVKDLVTEQGLSTGDSGLLLDFLGEISVGSGKMTTYGKDKGLQKGKPIGARLKGEAETIQAMKQLSQKLEKELAAAAPGSAADESARARDEALK
jgi:hypothetical protein